MQAERLFFGLRIAFVSEFRKTCLKLLGIYYIKCIEPFEVRIWSDMKMFGVL